MAHSFARHEQFLRIFTLLDILCSARQPIDDQALINRIKERLGLAQLSARTLHRDCDFLISCGYPLDRSQLPGDRRHAWGLAAHAATGRRQPPPEPLTVLELTAFSVARDLMRCFAGTVLWTGIESLREKIERDVPSVMLEQLQGARRAFRVEGVESGRHADRPRLLSAIASAILERREIEVLERDGDSGTVAQHRLQPYRIVIRPPGIFLLGVTVPQAATLLVDLAGVEKVTLLDATFVPATLEDD